MGVHALRNPLRRDRAEDQVLAPSSKAGKRAEPVAPNRMRASVLSVTNQHKYGELYTDFLRARKEVFIDQKGWDLPQTEGMEFDQYDTPQAKYVIIHEHGSILAGVRLLPTQARCGCYTYMLRDAQRGMLPDIPAHVLYETAPVAPHVWEATRLFITWTDSVSRRLMVQTKLMQAMAFGAQRQGATHVIGIVPSAFQRWMNRLNFHATPMGPKMAIGADKTQAAMMHVASQA